ncbi:PhnE/PtxC family ABC transporter permease [Ruminococcus sp.]
MGNSAVLLPQRAAQNHARRSRNGKIKVGAVNRSAVVLKILVGVLLFLTVYAFWSFDYKEIQLGEAIAATLHNMKTVFLEPKLSTDTIQNVLYQLLVTFCLGILSTIFGAVLAFFCALLCARNLAPARLADVIKSIVALVRAVPTVLWVLIFAVSAGLGSVAAVIGLTFHSFAYLTKVYAESMEEVDSGTLEALRASGAGFWQIVFQAIVPSAISRMVAWTFMRFEINFTNAVAMGAAAGAGGIGFQLFMAGSFYFNLHEMGFLTYVVVIAVVILEFCSTKIKATVK